jgi:hypothetical protein
VHHSWRVSPKKRRICAGGACVAGRMHLCTGVCRFVEAFVRQGRMSLAWDRVSACVWSPNRGVCHRWGRPCSGSYGARWHGDDGHSGGRRSMCHCCLVVVRKQGAHDEQSCVAARNPCSCYAQLGDGALDVKVQISRGADGSRRELDMEATPSTRGCCNPKAPCQD